MSNALFALIVEDRIEDFELVVAELGGAGFCGDCRRVETEGEYRAQLQASPDIILSDYRLPLFSAPRALEVLQESGLDIPLIVLTGAVGEETVVECMHRGAADYLLKDRLTRLVPAVRNAVAENELRRQKKAAELALRKSNERFQRLVETTNVIPCELDLDTWRFTYVGPQAEGFLGYSPEEWRAEGFWNAHFCPDDPQAPDTLRESPSQSARDHEFICRIEAKDGSMMYFHCALQSMCADTGVRIARGFLLDISALKRMERELARHSEELAAARQRAEEANRAKSEFLAVVSHEIRSPMNSILGMTDLLWESDLNPDQRCYVEVFRRAGSNLLTLINGILDISKIESGHLELERIRFDPRQVVDQAVELNAAAARSKGIDLQCLVARGVPGALIGDPTRLRQVLTNLLGNALKFTETGKIVLTADPAEPGPPGELQFTVRDTGIGVSAEQLPFIFDEFRQAGASVARLYGGSGLGLNISRRLVECMGGKLTAASELGKGSVFRFSAVFELPRQRKGDDPPEAGALSGTRILVVDGNTANRTVLRDMVAAWGFACDAAGASEDGAERVREAMAGARPYALAILAGGCDAAPFRKIARDLPVILLASWAQQSGLLRSIREAIQTPPINAASLATLAGAVDETKAPVPLRILVAEDSDDGRILMQAYLKTTPHSVTFAADGRVAVERVRDGQFDLILMDMQMPVMDGVAATRAIRAIESEQGWPRVPIIALTANARAQDFQISLGAGCDAHLVKPLSKCRLFEALKEFGVAAPDRNLERLKTRRTESDGVPLAEAR